MGTLLSVFREGPRAAIENSRETGGADASSAAAVSVVGKSGVTQATEHEQRKSGVTQHTEHEEEHLDESWPGDLCGFEEVTPEWKPWKGPQRIKESTQTPDEKKLISGLLDQIFHQDTIIGVKIVFHPDDVMRVVNAVIPYLESEPTLIEDVPFGVTIVGDIHGQLYDLDRVFKADAKDGKPGWECTKYVFLGNYVDRGRQSLEVVMALFCIKILYPDRKIAELLYFSLNEAFLFLSLAGIVGDIYFCSHGGIACTGFTRRQMRAMYKPFFHSADDVVVNDLTWSDPGVGLKGSVFNKSRGTSMVFGFDELCVALASMEVVAIFRAHTVIKTGYEVAWNTCFSIFTATNYSADNKGAVALVDEKGKVSIRVLEVDEGRRAWEAALHAVEYIKKEPGTKPEKKKKVNDPIGDKNFRIERFKMYLNEKKKPT